MCVKLLETDHYDIWYGYKYLYQEEAEEGEQSIFFFGWKKYQEFLTKKKLVFPKL
jgi:hypothetical protein